MILFFDCFSGISGDMTLGALVDLGVPCNWLVKQLKKMPLKDFDIRSKLVTRNGIKAQNLFVDYKDSKTARHYSDIKELIDGSPFSDMVKIKSRSIFRKIAEAEAEIHNCSIEHIHFHEVGAIDALVDIIGTVLAIEYLGIKKIFASRLPLGGGDIHCRHGILPGPAPATLSILKGVPVFGKNVAHETVTPTGAAIISSLADSFGEMPPMIIEKIGYGAGKYENAQSKNYLPNLLRIIMGTLSASFASTNSGSAEDVLVVETCIDDMNPEIFGFLMDRLFADGALDVYWMPVFMKKNRPGTMIQVLCQEKLKEVITHRIFNETTSIGLRYHTVKRDTLQRTRIIAKTRYGKVPAKQIQELNGGMRIVPEYEECKKIALEKKLSIRSVYEALISDLAQNSGK